MNTIKLQILVVGLLVGAVAVTGCTTKKPLKLTEEMVLDQPFPQQTEEHFVYNFDLERMAVSKEIKDPDEATKRAAQKVTERLKIEALRKAAEEINAILDHPLSQDELSARVEKAGTIHTKFIAEFKLLKSEVEEGASGPVEVVLSGYFKISRPAFKEFLVDAVKSVDLVIEEGDVLITEDPVSTSQTHVVSFTDVVGEVTDKISDRTAAHTQAVRSLVGDLKMKALREAAEEINHTLAQPMDSAEFQRAIEKAGHNFQDYISDWKLTKKKLEQIKTYLGTKESVRISGWFAVDKDKLRKTLVEGRAITAVSKYRTYVEAFWNVPDKEVNPDVINTVIANVEDHFSQQGYEVVDFERIKGDLVQMLNNEGEKSDDLFSQDELERFEANLNLRNIDSRFVNGKRILADYADLLIGVSITSMEVRDRMVRVRVTVNATLFENGEWVGLAHQDGSASAPYVRGSTDSLIFVAKRVALDTVAGLEPKARKQIALRKTKEEIRSSEEREFTLVFKGAGKGVFNELKRKMMEGQDWAFRGADTQKQTIRVGFRGSIDNLAVGVDDFLKEVGLKVGIPEYSRGQNRILFGGGE